MITCLCNLLVYVSYPCTYMSDCFKSIVLVINNFRLVCKTEHVLCNVVCTYCISNCSYHPCCSHCLNCFRIDAHYPTDALCTHGLKKHKPVVLIATGTFHSGVQFVRSEE